MDVLGFPFMADTSQSSLIRATVCAKTDVGRTRSVNEDTYLVGDLAREETIERGPSFCDQLESADGIVLGVFDGYGGGGGVAGEIAADVLVKNLRSASQGNGEVDFKEVLDKSLQKANARIYERANEAEDDRLGTTATVAVFCDEHLYVAHVGDSRGYLLRGDRLIRLSRDQTLVSEMVAAGLISPKQGETEEHSNIVMQLLGGAEHRVRVEHKTKVIHDGDLLLLCTDGLTRHVGETTLREILASNPEPEDSCKSLIAEANGAGGHDNVTVVVARFDGLSPESTSGSAKDGGTLATLKRGLRRLLMKE
jgi:protein phosphatase